MHHDDGKLDGLIILQVDDRFGIGYPKFMADKERAKKASKSKPRTSLNPG